MQTARAQCCTASVSTQSAGESGYGFGAATLLGAAPYSGYCWPTLVQELGARSLGNRPERLNGGSATEFLRRKTLQGKPRQNADTCTITSLHASVRSKCRCNANRDERS